MANFPAGPINGQTTTINGIVYVYDDTKTAWKRSTSFAGNLTILGNVTSANVVTGNVYTSGGIYWSTNGAAYSSGATGSSNFLYTASATAPGSPTKGDQWFDTTDGTLYEYIDDGDSFQWVDVQTPTLSSDTIVTALTGDVSTSGNISGSTIIITSGIQWSNGTPFASSVYSNVNVEAYIGGNLGSYQTYANTTFSTVANAGSQQTAINNLNSNIGAFYTYANTKIGTNTNSNLVANATTTSTSTTTGALVVRGGAGIAGNVTSANVVTGNVFMSSGVYWSNNGAAYSSGGSPFASNIVITSGTASTNLTSGAIVVTGSGGVAVGGRINAGDTISTASGGSDITGDSYYRGGFLQVLGTGTSTSTTTGALTVQNGGLGVTGNVYIGNELVVPGGGKITSTGLAYLLEKITVTASAPSSTVDVDMSTQSVMYWTGNATANVTANIRGTATQPLNSLLAIGQSVTAVLFFPNGPSNYLVNTVKIDNTTVPVAYQGNAAPVLGNSNSIDIYSFTILKTASATYKIFASQTQFMHPG